MTKAPKTKMINVLCGECGFHITDPKCVAYVEHDAFASVGITCPRCGAHHHLDLTERIKEFREQR